jgi:uncharacterized membrane protein YhaH (DUF805 family)
MISPLSFKGRIGRLPYALWSLGAFFSQHIIIAAVTGGGIPRLDAPWGYPVLLVIPRSALGALIVWLGFAYILLVAWALAAFAYRRAADANVGEWIAPLAVLPYIQIPVILFLSVTPSRTDTGREASATSAAMPVAVGEAAAGVLAGAVLTGLSVALGALVLGVYGIGLFLVAPFVIGVITSYLANYRGDIGRWKSFLLVLTAMTVGSLAVVLVALEGIICIAMAAPLELCLALLGSYVGRDIALRSRRPAERTLSCVALLPLALAVEKVLPPSTSFETVQTIVVEAAPEAVWRSLLSTDPVEGPLALPFRLGVAYPLRGEVIGEGVGATRRGEFSTGSAIERVTEWEPNRKFAFVVVEDIPAMRELSPYEHVHAPHVVGYFRTMHTSFELVSRPDGHTEIIERTSHELRLDPALYWLPIARWVVHENNARVLAHIRRHAERSVRTGG